MADDDVLRSARLPDVSVDADQALARTVGRGRTRRRRRLGALGAGAALVVLGVIAATPALSGRDGHDRVATGPTTVRGTDGATTTTAVVPPEPEPGDVATWTIDGNVPPSPDASTFTARVTRLGCNAGETGTVLRPGVVVRDTEVVVTFTVEAVAAVATCPGNDAVPYEVDLGEPLGERPLLDGACTDEGTAPSPCAEDGGMRWPLAPGQPHTCDAPEGAATDVARHPPALPVEGLVPPWTDQAGCRVRTDVIREVSKSPGCDVGAVRILIVGDPLGTPYLDGNVAAYTRDPDGLVGVPELAEGFDPDAVLPEAAVDSGFRRAGVALWHVPADLSAIWMVSPDGVERWPRGAKDGCP